MGRVILNLAISLDGRIVDENNNYDWIKGDGNSQNNTEKQFDFQGFVDDCDTMIFGKIAYDEAPAETMEMFNDKRIIVLTRSLEKPNRENVEFFNGDLPSLVESIKDSNQKNIYVWGGSSVANILIKENMIDEYILGIIPTIVGKGTRLFGDDNPMIELKLDECTISDGITILRYSKRSQS